MAWTTPKTWTVSEVATNTMLNTHLRDNLRALLGERTCPNGVSGVSPHYAFGSSPPTLTATQTRYVRALGYGSISKIGLHVQTSTGNISVAVYDNTGSGINARPNNRLVSSGSVACPAVGYAEVSLGGTQAVTAGAHWLAHSNSAASAFYGISGQAQSDSGLGTGTAFRENVHPAPATATASPTAIQNPILMVGVA